ncbi:hypothetical protein GCM10022225_07690 [Plantactinospora mayteni]|uniref:Carrier domain-containing protein n=1 Tax=Plantactinospora mayteni TaxID=566021 RepID=A0ABQ4EIE6_9ACTN|nr:phosphopantetheine-binding protein [Plantactinospora mayteni]GIG94485.1 hypothetical protein Pma05_10580 [Plantactinospora mayteni]
MSVVGGPADGTALAAVVTLVRDLLKDPEIRPEDDFFAVGGHSLLIVRIIRRLQIEHGLVLDARAFAVNAQLAALAEACRAVPSEDVLR